MPIITTAEHDVKPEWVRFSSWGIYRAPRGSSCEVHYHDCDEYWLVVEGRARVMTEGVEYEVGPGDMVATRRGDEHVVLEVLEDVVWVFLTDELQGEKRPGHLHRRENPQDSL